MFMQCIVFSTDDHSRVVLEKIEGDPKSDYINASYIPVRFMTLFIIVFLVELKSQKFDID